MGKETLHDRGVTLMERPNRPGFARWASSGDGRFVSVRTGGSSTVKARRRQALNRSENEVLDRTRGAPDHSQGGPMIFPIFIKLRFTVISLDCPMACVFRHLADFDRVFWSWGQRAYVAAP